MSKEPTDVMIAAYYETAPAKQDYEAVKASGAKLEGAVCVGRDHALGGLAHHEVKKKIEQQAFENIPYGGAGLIVAFPRSSADEVEKAVTHALKTAVGEADGKKVAALKEAMAEAAEKLKQPTQ